MNYVKKIGPIKASDLPDLVQTIKDWLKEYDMEGMIDGEDWYMIFADWVTRKNLAK